MTIPAMTTPIDAATSPVTCSKAARMLRLAVWPRSPRTAQLLMAGPTSAKARFRPTSRPAVLSTNSSYPRCSNSYPICSLRKSGLGLSPPRITMLEVGQEHPVAQALVADRQHRQAVPVEQQEQHLDAPSHRLDPVGRQPDPRRDVSRAVAVES